MRKTILLLLAIVCFAAATERVEENNAADQLVRQVNQMESAIRTEQGNHDSLWDSQHQDCNNEIAFRNQEVEDASNAWRNSASAQNRDESALSGAKLSQAKAQGYVTGINSVLHNLRVQRETEHDHFVDVVENQLNPAIDAVNGVYPLLDELSQQASSNNGDVTLVQLSSHINKSFIHMIRAQKGVQFTAILSQLLSKQVGIQQDVIDRLVQLFDDLADDLQQAKNTATDNENAAQELYDTTVANYQAILVTLNATLEHLEAYITELNVAIREEQSVQESATAKQNRNQSALDHAVDMCQAFETEYHNATNSREQEINLLNKLKSFVREQEEIFGNYGVDEVDALSEYQRSFAETKAQNRANFLQLSLKEFKANQGEAVAPSKQCESCKRSFLQKKLGF